MLRFAVCLVPLLPACKFTGEVRLPSDGNPPGVFDLGVGFGSIEDFDGGGRDGPGNAFCEGSDEWDTDSATCGGVSLSPSALQALFAD